MAVTVGLMFRVYALTTRTSQARSIRGGGGFRVEGIGFDWFKVLNFDSTTGCTVTVRADGDFTS